MAYAALISLQQTTDLVLNHHNYSISVVERDIITSIGEYVIFLIPFLENFSEKANRLEGKIRDLANELKMLLNMSCGINFRWVGELNLKARLAATEKIDVVIGLDEDLIAIKGRICGESRRYLIVLDDIWSTKIWNDVRNIFPDDNNGSRIMLTTRLSDEVHG
ncbi:hypothetical protein ACS0TY_004811 [Phlomoides rotata]